MPKKEKPLVLAVIDIGSNELRLKVAEQRKTKIRYVENLSYPLSLGRDTFNMGKLSFQKIEKACEIIKNFINLASEYGPSEIIAIATTAVREAENYDYILDQIKIKTGLSVNIIDDNEEKLYVYKLMSYMTDDDLMQSSMMVNIGSGNVGIAIFEDGKIPVTHNIKVGSLRLSELFVEWNEYSNEFYIVIEEYLSSFTDTLIGTIPENIKHFIASGHEISLIGELCHLQDGLQFNIPRNKFMELYNEIKFKTVDRIVMDYGISTERAELLFPAMCIYKDLMELTKTETIVVSNTLLIDALVYEGMFPERFDDISHEFDKSTIVSARVLADKYRSLKEHCERTEAYALKIFDKMKGLHGMGRRERLLLQVAAIVHDIGRYVNINEHYVYSYYLIKGAEIVGLNLLEKEMIALIAKSHSHVAPGNDETYKRLSTNNRVQVSKLAAILRIADALDRSHHRKFDDIDVKISENEMTVTVSTDVSVDLEEWAFNEKGAFFGEVFGIKAVIKKKRQT